MHGAARREAAPLPDLCVGLHAAGFIHGERAHVGLEGAIADAVPDPAFAGNGDAQRVGEDVVVELEGGVGDDGLMDARQRSFALLRMTEARADGIAAEGGQNIPGGHLAAVVVAAAAVRGGGVERLEDLLHARLQKRRSRSKSGKGAASHV